MSPKAPAKAVSRDFYTSALPGAPVDRRFFRNLEQACRYYNARIKVIPLKAFDPEDELDDIITGSPFVDIVDTDFDLNKHLMIRQMFINPTAANPLQGMKAVIEVNHSGIFGSPKQHLQVYSNSNVSLPKIAMSTGACTEAYYPNLSKQHKMAQETHVIGAIYVERNAVKFHYRQTQALSDGSFIDLCRKFNGRVKPSQVRPAAMVLGDIHTGDTDPVSLAVTKQMIARFRPKELILHDLFDGASVNHHSADDVMFRARRFAKGDLLAEFGACVDMLKDLHSAGPRDMLVKVVKSNHDEFLNRYLSEGRFSQDPRNLHIATYCAHYYTDPSVNVDPLKLGLEYVNGGAFRNVEFLQRGQDYKILGWQLANHGDKGVRGKKNISIQDISYVVGKAIVGHTHTPGIFRNAVIVGTTSTLNPEYKQGTGNDWMHTHALLYPNGKVQLVNIIDGKYEL